MEQDLVLSHISCVTGENTAAQTQSSSASVSSLKAKVLIHIPALCQSQIQADTE